MKKYLIIIFVIISIIGTLPIWVSDYPPLQDYPVHLLQANVFLQYNNPELNYQKDWTIQHIPVPYTGFFLLTIFFGQFFNIFIAGKLTLTAYFILFPLSILYFITAFKNKKEVLAFFAFLFIYNRAFFAGEINFVLGVTTVFFAMGYWFRLFVKDLDSVNILKRLFLSFLITITYITHLTAFAFTSASIFISIFLRRSFKEGFYFVLPLFIPSIIFMLLLMPKNISPSELTIDLASPLDIAKRLLYFFSGYNPRLDFILIIPVFIFYIVLLLKGIKLAKSKKSQSQQSCGAFFTPKNGHSTIAAKQQGINPFVGNNKKILMLIYALLVSFFLLLITPNYINPYVGDIPERIFLVLVLFGLPLLAVPKNQKVFAITLISIFILIILVKIPQFLDENEHIKLILNAYDKIPDKQPVFFIREQINSRGIIVPSYHLWAYYNIKKGGGLPFLDAIFMPAIYKNNVNLTKNNLEEFPYIVVLGKLSNGSQPQYNKIFSNNLTEVYKTQIN